MLVKKGKLIYIFLSLKKLKNYKTHCYFLDNLAKGNGGAIGLVSNPTYVDNCIFTNNTACMSGGAIFSDTLTINNSTFDGNNAWTNGGGFMQDTY